MKRFLTLMGVAVVAAAMYVAASPASRQASRPTARQFKALKRQVATLSKRVNSLKKVTAAELVLLSSCDQGAAPIAQYGDTSAAPKEGYEYQAAGRAGAAADPHDRARPGAAADREHGMVRVRILGVRQPPECRRTPPRRGHGRDPASAVHYAPAVAQGPPALS